MILEGEQQHGVSVGKATAKQGNEKYEGNTSMILFQWMMKRCGKGLSVSYSFNNILIG